MRARNAGRALWVLGNRITCQANADDTLGAYSLFDVTVPARSGVPAHCHHATDEALYVIEGELRFLTDGQVEQVHAGWHTVVSPGQVHGYYNDSDQPVRLVLVSSPGGMESLFEAIGQPEGEARRRAPGIEAMAEQAIRHDCFVVSSEPEALTV